MLTVDVAFAAILVGTVIPILVGIITKSSAASGLKAVGLLFLSVAGGVLATAVESNQGLIEKPTLIAAGVTFVTAVATYYGFLKPTGASPAVNNATAGFGVG